MSNAVTSGVLTTVQMFVLGELIKGKKTALQLRNMLSAIGQEKAVPVFYQFMDRMVASGYVIKEHEPRSEKELAVVPRPRALHTNVCHYYISEFGQQVYQDNARFLKPQIKKMK
jgi:hypothetical protein